MKTSTMFIGLFGWASALSVMFSGWNYHWVLGLAGLVSFISITYLLIVNDLEQSPKPKSSGGKRK